MRMFYRPIEQIYMVIKIDFVKQRNEIKADILSKKVIYHTFAPSLFNYYNRRAEKSQRREANFRSVEKIIKLDKTIQ